MKETQELNAVVTTVAPNRVSVEVIDLASFAIAQEKLAVGSYLRISDSSDCAIVAIIQSFSIQKDSDSPRRYVLDALPIGFLDSKGDFVRGGSNIAIPPTGVTPATRKDVESIYRKVPPQRALEFAKLAMDSGVSVPVDGDRFFSKHVAVVGSTGCGKSCTVARIIQSAVNARNEGVAERNNSHVVIFDLHSEYKSAFPRARYLDVKDILLPFWLMNGEELEELLVETGDMQAYNQTAILRRLITRNKQVSSGDSAVLFDSPVKFSMRQVLNAVVNLSRETRDAKNPTSIMFKSGPKGFVTDEERFDHYFKQEYVFEETKAQSVNKGTYNDGSLEKFVSRLRTKLEDRRLNFLLGDQAEFISFETALKECIGYAEGKEANVTLFDLSGVPFEVLSITVSLISRLLFDFGYYLRRSAIGPECVAPLFLVYEEAHRYVPASTGARYSASRKAIERIAKEGRKYGVTLALVTQRPSEISETIFSQCANFVAMRLSNPDDQGYVRRLLPDALGPITESLATLESGSAILIGDAVVMPALVTIDRCEEEPSSADIAYLTEWKKAWQKVDFDEVSKTWD